MSVVIEAIKWYLVYCFIVIGLLGILWLYEDYCNDLTDNLTNNLDNLADNLTNILFILVGLVILVLMV